MKKVIYFIALGTLLIGGASCGKKYNCVCEEYSSGLETTSTVRGVNKDAAATTCVAKSNSDRICVLQ
ncbi:MAG: hypothetical protein JST82_09825 [Bacteroidetes bacterium]|nr:hypothetical protein [Bacteroidota bacterium]